MQQPISLFHSIFLSSITTIHVLFINRVSRLERWLLCTKTSMNTSLLQLGNSVAHETNFKFCTALQNNLSLSWIQVTDFTNLHVGLNPIKPHQQNFSIVTTKAPKGYHKLQMLVKIKQCLNLCKGIGLVIMSARLYAVPIFLRRISPSSIISRTKWKRTSICLVREW